MKGKQQDFRTEKYIRYGIRKYSFGAASVAIAAGLMFLGNGAVSATEVQSAETTISTPAPSQDDKEKEKAELKAETVETVKPETEKATEAKPEAKKVNKAVLEASIATLERNIKSAPDADQAVLSVAREALEKAKAVLSNDATTQEEVDAQVKIVNDLDVVVTEAQAAGVTAKVEEKKAEEKAKSEAKQTLEVKEAKKELTQVASEAEVTNKLAETELAKADVKEENKAAVTAAVAKNQAVLTETKALLADKSVTKEQVDAQLERLNESILAVYNELKNAGIGRDGKFSYVLADVADTVAEPPLSEQEQVDHWKKYKDKNTNRLSQQIKWFDIGSTTAKIKGLASDGTLQVGTEFSEELSPGYVVTLTVKKLAPFNSTDVYKERGGAFYDANATNQHYTGVDVGLKMGTQNSYSSAKNNGLDTRGKTVLLSTKNGANVGVEFAIKATYNGKEVPANPVFITGEEAGFQETEIYTTDGDGFELVTELSNSTTKYPTYRSYMTQALDRRPIKNISKDKNNEPGLREQFGTRGTELFYKYGTNNGVGVFNPDITTETVSTVTENGVTHADGLGTQVFGPVATHITSGLSTPMVMSRNAKNIGMYIYATGTQAAMLGFMMLDEGDAPASYGRVAHSISKANGQKQPYLGSVAPDVDIRTTPINKTTAFKYDDNHGDGAADEGARQLMGDGVQVNDNYTLHKVNDNTYSMTFDAHLDGEPSAWVNGWIDFNGNGKFDEGEAATPTEVTKDGKVTLTWINNVQNVDTTQTKLATRLRIALDKADITTPTGIAYSGEVEDFQIQQTIPPRGTKEETHGIQGATQNATVQFNAYGQINYDFSEINTINTSVKSQIVKADGSLVKDTELVDGYYVVQGQGKYKITDNGKDVNVEFVPDPNFVGTADGITIRRTDANGNTTGWGNEGRQIVGGEGENKDQLNLISDQVQLDGLTVKGSMDGRYIPTVTPKPITADPEKSTDIQGKAQTKTPKFTIDVDKDGNGTTPDPVTPSAQYPAKLIDPKTKAEVNSVTVEGEGNYTINPTTGEVTFQPLPTFKGTATGVDVTLTAPVGRNKEGQDVTAKATTKYTPTVTAVEPTAKPTDSAGVQGETQKGTPTFTAGNAEVPIKEDSHKLLDKEGNEVQPGQTTPAYAEDGVTEVGTYSINPTTGEVTFTPTDKTYTGKVTPAKVQAEDKNGTKVNTTYTPHIVGVTPTATPAESSGIQGQPQDGTVSFTKGETTIEGEKKSVPIKANSAVLLDASGNPVTAGAPVDALDPEGNKVGEYTIDPATNKVTFTPTNKEYKGKVQPAKVQAEDENGTKVKTTYTPHIVGVVPTAEPATSTDIQGVEQSKEVTFTPGKTEINGTEKTVAIDTTSFKLLDENENAVDSVPAKNPAGDVIGTYTLKVVDGKVNAVFTPTDKTYAGEVEPVTIQAKDTNGTVVKTTYTPSITPVEPSGTPTTSEGIQGAKQEGTPSFTPGDERIPMKIDADQPAKLVNPETGKPIDDTTIPAKDNDGNTVGTYTIEPTTGKVTFTPNKDFTGTPVAATVQAKDANGTPTTATYEPTVKPVTPTGSDTVTEDVQGSIQKGKPTFEGGTVTVNGEEKTVAIDEDKPAKLVDPKTGDPVESVTIDGEGTYTVTPDGIVTFTPEKNFTGKGTGVTVQREDKNATPVTAKYTPVVKPATPTSSDVITTNVQGAIQEGTPTFTGGKVTINGQEKTVAIDEAVKPKFDDGTTEKVVPNEGTYTIDENGKVTFTPEKTFTGQAAGVTVKRVDKNGTPVTAKYTPVVIPVSPTSKDAESEGPKGQSQEGTPTFTGGKVTLNGKEVPVAIDENVKPKFDDGTTEKVVPNEGTYTIDENGKVTFTPEPNFVGKATGVTVKRVDKNGTPVTAKYTPTVRPDTRFVVIEKDGKETDLLPSKDGAKPSEPIPGYNVVRTEIDEKGNTKHIYEKVKTSFKDKEGNEIPKYPSEPGTVDKKDIPEYRFVETKKLPNGDTEHVYEKVTTSFKDKEGNEIPGNPTEEGEKPKKDIPGYKFVTTNKLPNGDTEHVYEKVTTSFKDKEGNEIPGNPTEEGEQPKKDIPGYEFVTTTTDKDGNVTHVYRKVVKTTTSFVDESGKPVSPNEEGDQPKKDIPGYRFVETKKLPNGNTEHVYEKVTPPAPTPTPTPFEYKVITTYVDENGELIIPDENGSHPGKSLEGYELVRTKTDANGNVHNVYRKIQSQKPVQPVEPAKPAMPEQPAKPEVPATPAQPVQPTAVKEAEGKRELPNTGTEDNASLAALGLLGVLSGFGLVARKKKED